MWANSDRKHNFLALRLISFSWRNQELKELESFELISQHFLIPRSLFCLGNDGSALSKLLPGEIPGVQLGKAQGGEGLQLLQEQPRGTLSSGRITTDRPNSCSLPVSGLPRKAGRKSSTCQEERRP